MPLKTSAERELDIFDTTRLRAASAPAVQEDSVAEPPPAVPAPEEPPPQKAPPSAGKAPKQKQQASPQKPDLPAPQVPSHPREALLDQVKRAKAVLPSFTSSIRFQDTREGAESFEEAVDQLSRVLGTKLPQAVILRALRVLFVTATDELCKHAEDQGIRLGSTWRGDPVAILEAENQVVNLLSTVLRRRPRV